MEVSDIVWLERYAAKIRHKHHVSLSEAEEVLFSKPFVRKIARGRVRGENLYAAFSQTSSGRYLTVIFIAKKTGAALPISARDMDDSERKYYGRHR